MKSNDIFQQFYDQTYDAAIEYILLKTGDLQFSSRTTVECYKTILKAFQNSKNDTTDYTDLLYEHLNQNISKYWKEHRSFSPITREILIPQNEQMNLLEQTMQTPLSEELAQLSGETAARIVADCLQAQSPLQRRAFVLYFFFKLSIEDCAALLEITPNAARLYINEVLQQILDNISTYSLKM